MQIVERNLCIIKGIMSDEVDFKSKTLFHSKSYLWKKVTPLRKTIWILCLWLIFTTIDLLKAEEYGARNTLINLCNKDQEAKFEKFLTILSEYGPTKRVYSDSLRQTEKNVFNTDESGTLEDYQNVILLCPNIGIDNGELYKPLNELSSKKNVIMSIDMKNFYGMEEPNSISKSINKFISSLEIHYKIPYNQTDISDNYSNYSGDFNKVLITEGFNKVIFGANMNRVAPVVYKGKGHFSNTTKNKHMFPILYGNPSTYVKDKYDSNNVRDHGTSGREVALLTGLQSSLGARTVISLSNALYTDEFINLENNKGFVKELLKWVYLESKIIKIDSFEVVSSSESREFEPDEKIRVELSASELIDGQYTPLIRNDLQVELRGLERMTIITLEKNIKHDGSYFGYITLPPHHGIYKIILKYQRPGYNFINESIDIFVKPFFRYSYNPFHLQNSFYYIIFSTSFISIPLFFIYLLSSLDKKSVKVENH